MRRRHIRRLRPTPVRRLRLEVLERRDLLSASGLAAGDAPPAWEALAIEGEAPANVNRAITTDAGVQQMPSVAVNPLDSQHVVIAYMDYSLLDTGYAGLAVSVSRDGGDTWLAEAVPLPEHYQEGAANPTAQFDAHGRLFVSFMAATFQGGKPPLTNPDRGEPRTLGFESNNGIFVARSDDGGQTWQTPLPVTSHRYDGQQLVPFEILPDLSIDTYRVLPNGELNANFGNLYATWSRYYPPGQFPGHADSIGGSDIMFAVSSDGGLTWETRTRSQPETGVPETILQDPFNTGTDKLMSGTGYSGWSHPSVGPEGDVYVSQFSGLWFPVNHSVDGGQSFFVPTQEDDIGMPFGVGSRSLTFGLTENRFRVQPVRAIASDPHRPGHVYVAEVLDVIDPAGNPLDQADIFFSSSMDYGRTWNQSFLIAGRQAEVVNDDNAGQTGTGVLTDVHATQVMVKLDVDSVGNIGLFWLDTRRDPANHNLDVFGAVSTDGGQSFGPNFRVTDHSFDADRGRFVDASGEENFYLGDSIGLDLAGGVGVVAWTDTRDGNQDIFFRRVPLVPPPAPANDRFEPNDSAALAARLGSVVERHVPRLAMALGDDDWFQVQATSSGHLTVTMLSASAVDFVMELWHPDGTRIAHESTLVLDAQGDAVGRKVETAALPREDFLIHLARPLAVAAAEYSLTVQSLTADLGTVVYRAVEGDLAANDEANYLVKTAATGTISARVVVASDRQDDVVLEILDAQSLATLATNAGGTAQTELSVLQGSQVLVHVTSRNGSLGQYRLELVNHDQFNAVGSNILHFQAGLQPSQQAIADFNGDGVSDVAIANAGSNTVSLLLGGGDGVFLAPRQFGIGAFHTPNRVGEDTRLGSYRRDILAADFNRDGFMDLAVTNYDSSDVSILLGRGDGSFEPQRRMDATAFPMGMSAADVNHDGNIDLLVVDGFLEDVPNSFAVLLGRGDGSFEPQRLQELPNILVFGVLSLADLNGDDNLDVVVGGGNHEGIDILLGDGAGGFHFFAHDSGSRQATDMVIADIDGDGFLDILATSLDSADSVVLIRGIGGARFGTPRTYFSGQGPLSLKLVDWGNETESPDGSTALGPPDGRLDVVVANSGATVNFRPYPASPDIVVLPGLANEDGSFAGFGSPQRIASAEQPLDLEIRDFNDDGILDIGVVDRNEYFVIFGQPPNILANDSLATARDLGEVVHLVQSARNITPENTSDYFRLTVPIGFGSQSSDIILDFSGGFQNREGLGLEMEVLDIGGAVLAAGERLRVQARQGQTLYVRVFAAVGIDDGQGYGSYSLVIDALPQVVSVEAQSLLPGQGTRPGGPTTALALVLQGDRLDASTAENAANYRVTWLGLDGIPGTNDDRVIPVGVGLTGSQPVVYSPGANVDVTSGRSYPTAIRQTVTLLFGEPLPAGSYQVDVSPHIRAAPFNAEEQSLLSPRDGFSGHAVVSVVAGAVREGVTFVANNLIQPSAVLGDFSIFEQGTRFLTQLHNDLGALLDAQLTSRGDDPTITQQILDQIFARLAPALGPTSERLASLLVIFLDPVSIGLVDPAGRSFQYNLETNAVANALPRTFVEVGGNVEIMVIAEPRGIYQLDVANVSARARGGAIYLGRETVEVRSITDALRTGSRSFSFTTESPAATGFNTAGILALSATFRQAATIAASLVTPQIVNATSRQQPVGANSRAESTFISATSGGVASPASGSSPAFDSGDGTAEEVLLDQMHELFERVFELWGKLFGRVRGARRLREIRAAQDPTIAPDIFAPDMWQAIQRLVQGKEPSDRRVRAQSDSATAAPRDGGQADTRPVPQPSEEQDATAAIQQAETALSPTVGMTPATPKPPADSLLPKANTQRQHTAKPIPTT